MKTRSIVCSAAVACLLMATQAAKADFFFDFEAGFPPTGMTFTLPASATASATIESNCSRGWHIPVARGRRM